MEDKTKNFDKTIREHQQLVIELVSFDIIERHYELKNRKILKIDVFKQRLEWLNGEISIKTYEINIFFILHKS